MAHVITQFRPYNKAVAVLRAVVEAQLVEWSIPTPEVCGSNAVISKFFIEDFFTVNCFEKTKNKEKGGQEWPI